MHPKFKIASYLDEASEEPVNGCDVLIKHDIRYVVLRHTWGGKNICDCNDLAHKKIKGILTDKGISVVSISSNIGDVPAGQLQSVSNDILNKVFDIAAYYGAESIRFLAGTKTTSDSIPIINDWLHRITQLSIHNNIVPMLEVTHDAHVREPANVANMLSQHKRWKVLYDPVQIILKRKLDPFIRYWSLLKNNVAAIDVRDYIVGKGFKPPGFGDSKIKEVLEDAENSKFKGWLFVEPNLGRRYGSARSKEETFGLAMEGLRYIIG